MITNKEYSMSMDFIEDRLQVLSQEFENAKNNLTSLSEKYEQAKSHFHKVSGHLQEIIYMKEEANKLKGECQDGKVNNESQEQVTEV
jgi:uncharacterized protein Smg (DUF494 family)